MKRQRFLVTTLAAAAFARTTGAPALASFARSHRTVTRVAIRRRLASAGSPGGCGNHRKPSLFGGYTLASILGPRLG